MLKTLWNVQTSVICHIHFYPSSADAYPFCSARGWQSLSCSEQSRFCDPDFKQDLERVQQRMMKALENVMLAGRWQEQARAVLSREDGRGTHDIITQIFKQRGNEETGFVSTKEQGKKSQAEYVAKEIWVNGRDTLVWIFGAGCGFATAAWCEGSHIGHPRLTGMVWRAFGSRLCRMTLRDPFQLHFLWFWNNSKITPWQHMSWDYLF